MLRGATSDQFDRITRELNEERAAALKRISGTLEWLIGQMHATRERIASVPESERDAEVAAFRALERKAYEYRWYLEVQRESLGLRHHHRLDEFYKIPRLGDTV